LGSGSFGKEEDGRPIVESVQDCFQSRTPTAIAVDRDRVQLADVPAQDGDLEKGVSGQKIDSPRNRATNERGVCEARVVGGQNHRADQWDILYVFDLGAVDATGSKA
jgi:hypothetical protein